MFGQAGAAQAHLQYARIDKGDLFLYFGWFQEVERRNGADRFVRNAPDQHSLFGWYVVQVWQTPRPTPKWAALADWKKAPAKYERD
jgi:hypothetical protein